MARIRSVKPEFWEDEAVAMLSRDARLLFIATWNLADDEGLLRWTPEYIKAQVFMYDEDIDIDSAQALMDELTGSRLLLAYRGGKLQQRLAWIVNFPKHQRPNRPQPSKLPPPSLQNRDVVRAYAERDGWSCHICGEIIESDASLITDDAKKVSLDHLEPRSKGGSDYPTNIKIAHCDCNSGKGNRRTDSFHPSELTDSRSDSLNGSVNDSPPEGRGGEGRGEDSCASGARESLAAAISTACHMEHPAKGTKPHQQLMAAVSDLHAQGALPHEVPARAREYRRRWPDATLTPHAMAKHWPQLAPEPPKVPRTDDPAEARRRFEALTGGATA